METATRAPRRKIATIPRGNPLAHLLGKDLIGRASRRMPHGREMVSVDYFCGGGGLSTGIARGMERNGIVAWSHYGINHDSTAIQTISSNHRGTYVNSSVEPIPIRDIVREGYVTLFTGAAECIMHSSARRDDLPIYDQSRTSAAYMLEAIRDLPPEAIIIENVQEWSRWARLDPKTKRPKKDYEGEYFDAFLGAIRDMGYSVEWKILNAADYGGYQSRRRLFLLALADNERIIWPAQTHAKNPEKYPGQQLERWKPARDILRWDILGEEITAREDGPHAPKSLKRIRSGYTIQDAVLAPGYAQSITTFIPISEAFHATRHPKFDFTAEDFKTNSLLANYAKKPAKKKTVSPFSLRERVFISNVWRAMYGIPRASSELTKKERSTIRALGIEAAHTATRIAYQECSGDFEIDGTPEEIEAFLIANRLHAASRSTNAEPVPCATTAPGGGIAFVDSFLIGQQGGATARPVPLPTPTIAAGGAIAKVDPIQPQPTLIKMNVGQNSTYHDEVRLVDQTMQTIVKKTCQGLSAPVAPEPMIAALYGESRGRPRVPQSADDTINTQTGRPRFALVTNDLDAGIMPEPVISAYYGEKDGNVRKPIPVSGPLGTQPTERRFALLDPVSPEASATQMPLLAPDGIIVTVNHGGRDSARAKPPDSPVDAMTTHNSQAFVQPFIARHNSFYNEQDRGIESPDEPVSSISAGGMHHSLINPLQPFLLEQQSVGNDEAVQFADGPIPPITTISRNGLVQQTLQKSKRRVVGTRPGGFEDSLRPWIRINGAPYLIGTRFRMLLVEELARAGGFITKTHGYVFAGTTTDQIRAIGNAVEVTIAEALADAQLKSVLRRLRRDASIDLTEEDRAA